MTVIAGEYVTFKHVKTRKVVVLEVEVPEENFQNVIEVLGMPVGGESKPVAVALLDKSAINKPKPAEQTEGDRLRVRAVMLCQDRDFQRYCVECHPAASAAFGVESATINHLYKVCNITSRSELKTNEEAQRLFRELLGRFSEWQKNN